MEPNDEVHDKRSFWLLFIQIILLSCIVCTLSVPIGITIVNIKKMERLRILEQRDAEFTRYFKNHPKSRDEFIQYLMKEREAEATRILVDDYFYPEHK